MSAYQCPICEEPLTANARYPNYVCQSCYAKAVSLDGRPLQFGNVGLSGGYRAAYVDTHVAYESHDCYIDGVQCWADEARFGGIVIEVSVGDPTRVSVDS